MSYTETLSGRKFHFANPQPEEIWIGDIAAALSKLCRFTGQIPVFYSVAEHVVTGLRYINTYDRNIQRAWFLHDAAEAYLADLSSPVKAVIPAYQAIESTVMNAIFDKYGVEYDTSIHKTVKYIDYMMLRNEAEYMGKDINEWGWIMEYPKIEGFELSCWNWMEAERQFMMAFKELFGHGFIE